MNKHALKQRTATDSGGSQAVLGPEVAEADCFAELRPPARLTCYVIPSLSASHSFHLSVPRSIYLMLSKTITQQTASNGGDVTPALVPAPVLPLHHTDMPVDGVGC